MKQTNQSIVWSASFFLFKETLNDVADDKDFHQQYWQYEDESLVHEEPLLTHSNFFDFAAIAI